MTKEQLIEILDDFELDTEIRIQDPSNTNGFIDFKGFEVIRNMKGKPIIVLTNTKIVKNEFNG